MFRFLVAVALLSGPSLGSGSRWVQTDWMGGPGLLGPVSDWGTRYWVSDSVTAATEGQVSLVAASWDYFDWAKHVVESNGGIPAHAQGFMPADVDGDGIVDLVAHTADWVVWYGHDGYYNFTKNLIGPADDGGIDAPCVYPCDLDRDGDIDVLVATGGIGCGWYENEGLSWAYHSLDNTIGYHRISACDVELDNDMDVIAVDNVSHALHGDIYLFRNDGMTFTKELAVSFPGSQGWRVYPADFNSDGYPDLYSVKSYTYIFINDSTGGFDLAYYYYYSAPNDFDGAWASDIDMDGDLDLITANQYDNDPGHPYGFYAHLNDGTGWGYTCSLLVSVPDISYTDGSMARDLDLDGWPDIAGTRWRVGWFRQDPLNPLTFTLYDIDGPSYESHWIYADRLGNRCMPAMDLLITESGTHIVFENRMLQSFAGSGYLESSILELTDEASEPYNLRYFGYEACVPNDTALSFYWRAGADSAQVVNSSWNGPYLASIGMGVVDSFSLAPAVGRMFQYKAELKGAPDDIAALYEVWIEADTLIGGAGLVTGGGWIAGEPPGPGRKRTFGFNAHAKGGQVWGQLQFNDHGTKMKVHSDTIHTLVIQRGDTMAEFSGDCRVDGVSGCWFECEIMDIGEPGRHVDWFRIGIYDGDGNHFYSAGDYLEGGNIQIHKWPGNDSLKGGPGSETDTRDAPNARPGFERLGEVQTGGHGFLTNSPNPFSGSTSIRYRLTGPGGKTQDAKRTTLAIYDLSGKLVRTLVDEPGSQSTGQGVKELVWNGKDSAGRQVPTGVYLYRLTFGEFAMTRKMVLLR